MEEKEVKNTEVEQETNIEEAQTELSNGKEEGEDECHTQA